MIPLAPDLPDPFPFSFVLVLATLHINTKKGDYQESNEA